MGLVPVVRNRDIPDNHCRIVLTRERLEIETTIANIVNETGDDGEPGVVAPAGAAQSCQGWC